MAKITLSKRTLIRSLIIFVLVVVVAGVVAGSVIGGYSWGKSVKYDERYDEGYQEGEEIGFEKGQEEGYSQGESLGYEKGEEVGYDKGYEEGKTVGYNEGRTVGYQEGYAACPPRYYPPPYWPPVVYPDRFRVDVYQGENFECYVGSFEETRIDGIFHDWYLSGPFGLTDYFSIRWTGRIRFDSGYYRFTTKSDDGVRLYIDERPIINKWVRQGLTTYTADLYLSHDYHTIKLEYFEWVGAAYVNLHWERICDP